MINRFQLLRNIGMFASVDSASQIPLTRLVLVYGENGRGKTTLAAILRSLATGDPLPITERHRFAAEHPPHVIIDCDGGPTHAAFRDGAWSRTLPNLAIFDDEFVDHNVYSGLAVDAEHRRNLHELILGAQGVTLSGKLQRLVVRIEQHNRELRTRAAAIPDAEQGGLSTDDFCALGARPDIDREIQGTERALEAAREHDLVRTTAAIDALTLPAFDVAAIERVLREDLPALDVAAAAHVQAHAASLGAGGEEWIGEGMRRVGQPDPDGSTSSCPFCVQDLAASPVIAQYRAYFSEAYTDLKGRIDSLLAEVRSTHAGEVPAGFERAVRVAGERRLFWARFCDMPEVAIDTAAIMRDWRAALEGVATALTAKQAAPLEPMALDQYALDTIAAYELHRQEVADLSDSLSKSNDAIAAVKEKAEAANAEAIAADLMRLRSTKARHTADIAKHCEDYLEEKSAKDRTAREREEAHAELEEYKTNVFPGYAVEVNLYLQRFEAGFRLDRVTSTGTRGGPACTYDVIVNNTPISVTGGTPSPGEPSFRNTLSSGDRNTLALAFFFASLDQDPDIGDKVIVIDDPISSLDDHRSLTTVQETRRLANRAGQVIVLSHNKPFLCRIWDGADRSSRTAMEVARDVVGSTLRFWDVDQDSITEHDRRHAMLRAYMADGTSNIREVAQSIRPLLERFIRVAYPDHFPPGAQLGVFCRLCAGRGDTGREILDAGLTQELRDLKEYANKFHHDTNPAWETVVINDGELQRFVRDALRFTRR